MRNGVLGLLLMLLSFTAWSDGFEKGWDALVNGDYAGAKRQLAPLAQEGDAQAQYGLGLVYQRGWGRDYNEALKWLAKAAEQDYAPAQTELGRMYQWGEGVEQNDEMAVQWYTLAAEQGYASAQYNLGMMYQLGKGVEQNDEMAIQWYTLAAEQGLASAQFELGMIYARGDNVPQDYKMAEKWFTLAAEQPVEADDDFEKIGSIGGAQQYLGNMYALGKGVERDVKKAAKWYTLAAELGAPWVSLLLGKLYAEPSEIKDNVLAYKWLDIALFTNIKGASDARALVAAEMTPAEIASAQRLSFEYAQEKGFLQYVLIERGQKALKDKVLAYLWIDIATSPGGEDASDDSYAAFKNLSDAEQLDAQQLAGEWYALTAEKGYRIAQYKLGKMYELGRGVQKDKEAAMRWYALSAEQDDRDAQFRLGALLVTQPSELRDYVLAYKWLDIADSSGDKSASEVKSLISFSMSSAEVAKAKQLAQDEALQQNAQRENIWAYLSMDIAAATGDEYLSRARDFEGEALTPADISKAQQLTFDWYRLAAEQGYQHAQYLLGLLYAESSAYRDNGLAYMWLDIAASRDNEDASAARDLLGSEMSAVDIAKAQQLAVECVEQAYIGC